AADKTLAGLTDAATLAQEQLDAKRQALNELEKKKGEVVHRLLLAREQLARRAIGAYTGETLGQINAILESGDINEYVRRSGLLDGVLSQDRKAVAAYQKARKEAGEAAAKPVDEVNRITTELTAA